MSESEVGFLGMADATGRLVGIWSVNRPVSRETVEHDRPLLDAALDEGRRTVTVGWFRRRKWKFGEYIGPAIPTPEGESVT